ncbi:MAG: histidine kinase [Chloroflexus sp.]|uniref:PAS domain S-box protein n=1 Tax=Chloroflexus sp. TaxID=1904827 RepID=UPI0021DE05C8|nr:PAS domain S-box protein [Chloroflexus sp.]GIV88132.1 MAG: histidine kinase [Chloroflexus sp.]
MATPDLSMLQAECVQLRTQISNLQAELRRFKSIVEDTDQLITEVDPQGCFTYVNSAAERYFGEPPAACLGRSSLDFLHPDDREPARQALLDHLQRGERTLTIENRIVHRSGQITPMLWTITIHYDEQGQFASATSIASEISHIQRLRNELNASRAMLQLVIDNLPQAVFWKDREGRFLGCNRRFLADAGLQSVDEIVGRTDFELPWREYAEAYRADDLAVIQHGPKYNIEEPLIRQDGTTILIRTSKIPLQRDGEIIGVLGNYEDVTLLRQQEDELRTFKLLVENAPDGIAIADLALTLQYTNPALAGMLGYETLVGVNVNDIVYPPDLPILQQIAEQVMQGLTPREIVRYVHRDGRLVTVQASALALYDRHGHLSGYASINRDITEQIEAEEELRRSERHNRALLEAMPDLMFLLSADGVFLDYKADRSGTLLLPPEAFLGRHVTEVLPSYLANQVLVHMARLRETGEMQQYEYQIDFDGRIEEYEARMVSSNQDVLVLARNVTEQRRMERERAAMQEQIIAAQQATLRELSTPLMPIANGVVVMPLIGAIDTARAQQIMETLLYGVAEHHAQLAIIDITGVKVVDTQVAGALMRAAQAARMLGAQVLLTGISPEIAQTLVHIGAELRDLVTKATLQEGIDYALKRQMAVRR